MLFNEYFPSEPALIESYNRMLERILHDSPGKEYALALLDLLRLKNEATYFHYLHSLRVTVISSLTAVMMYLMPRPAFYSGMLHDVGKASMPNELLDPPGGLWTPQMGMEMQKHVKHTHLLLQGSFDYIAKIVMRHHKYQNHNYPKRYPINLRQYSEASEAAIPLFSVILSVADVYDAMHRITGKRALTGIEIKDNLLSHFQEWSVMIRGMYERNILTVYTQEENLGIWTPPTLKEMTSDSFLP